MLTSIIELFINIHSFKFQSMCYKQLVATHSYHHYLGKIKIICFKYCIYYINVILLQLNTYVLYVKNNILENKVRYSDNFLTFCYRYKKSKKAV